MNHRVALPVATLIVALTMAGCATSAASIAPLPTLEPTASPAPTPVPTVAPTATPQPTAVPTSTPTRTAAVTFPPAAGPAGRILFSVVEPTSPLADIYVMNSNGSGATKLPGTSGGDKAAWSPDGTLVAFVRDGLWVMHADGTFAKQIRHDPAKVSDWPAWSPDGRQIAFVEAPTCAPCPADRPWVLNVINVDGSGLRKVADAYHDDRPAWSPDGQAIAFAGPWAVEANLSTGVRLMGLDGTPRGLLTDGLDAAPTWSSTGQLAFMRNTADPAIPSWSLWVANADGSNPRPITLAFFAQGPVSWSPDGLWVALAAADYGPVTQIGMWDIWIIQPNGPGGMVLTKTSNRAETAPSWR